MLLKIIESCNGSCDVVFGAFSSSWATSQWLYPVHNPPPTCKLTDSMPCSVAQRIDFGFLLAFTIEAVVKLIALGFIGHPNAYLRSGW